MTSGDGGWYWGFWLSGIGLAVAFAIAGLAVVVSRAVSLRSRLRAYAELPVLTLAEATQRSAARFPEVLADASQLVPRAQRAVVDLQRARDTLERSATTVAGAAAALVRLFKR